MDYQKLIKELRDSGLTQREIAQAVGCRNTTISALESGQNRTSRFGLQLVRLLEQHCPESSLLAKAAG